MTKEEDEARLAREQEAWAGVCDRNGVESDMAFLIRLIGFARCDLHIVQDKLNEQAARVAKLEAAGDALVKEWGRQAGRVFENMGSDNPRALAIDEKVDALEAAIRARAGEATITGAPTCMRCGGYAESTETEGKCWVTAGTDRPAGEASEFGTVYPVWVKGRCARVAPGEVKP